MEAVEINLLKTRLAYLQGNLTTQADEMARAFKLTPQLAELLSLLMTSEVVPAKMIEVLRIAPLAKVVVNRLRRELRVHKLRLQSKRFVGYWLDAETKAEIRTRLAEVAGQAEPQVAEDDFTLACP